MAFRRTAAFGTFAYKYAKRVGRFFPIPAAWFLILTALTFLVLSAAATDQPTGFDLDGNAINPLQSNAGRVVVLFFVREDCPVSGRYAPTIRKLSEQHRAEAHFYLVFPDKSKTPTDIRKYLRDFHYSIPALRDPDHALVKQAHAQVTPEAAVFDAKGALIYHGRIDNLYETFGRSRPAPTTHEVEDAIQSAIAGRTLVQQDVAAIGCYLSDLQ
jgi:thiol-disulfide isomerase/thioredoxin